MFNHDDFTSRSVSSISIMTTHVPSTIYNLTYNAQLYLTIYQWLAGLQWNFCNQAGINHLEQMNGLVQN